MPNDVKVDVLAPAEQWIQAIEDISQLVTKTVEAAVKISQKINQNCEVCVVLSDDFELQVLNKEYRGIDSPTNVLSFPSDSIDKEDNESAYNFSGKPLMLGDIVIAYETMQKESLNSDTPLADHLAHILIHGVLHLCKFDHENDKDAQIMESMEIAILKELGVKNPYINDIDV